jgi:L-fuconolactonase
MPTRRTFIQSTLAVTVAGAMSGAARAQGSAPFRAPFKVFDSHPHVHSGELARFPYRVDIEPARRERALARPVTPEVLLKSWDEANVEMGCGVQFNALYSTDNRYLLHVAESHPRVLPVVILWANDPATPAALQSMVKAYGIRGVRFSGLPDGDGNFSFLGDDALRSWAAAEELGLVLVLMPMMSDNPRALPNAMRRIGELAARFPKLRIVMDHFGFPVAERTPTFGFSPEHRALAEHRNVYQKYTTFLLEVLRRGGVPDKEFFNYAVSVYGADRVIWGSDFGNTPGEMSAVLQRALVSAEDLTQEQRQRIFYENAMDLFVRNNRAASGRCA